MLVMVPGERHRTYTRAPPHTYIQGLCERRRALTKYQLLLRRVDCALLYIDSVYCTLLTDGSKQALFAADGIAGDLSAEVWEKVDT